MKIEVDLTDEGMIQYLTETARDQVWHINNTIKTLRNNYTDSDMPNHHLRDLQDFFATLEYTNNLIEYYGGEKVEVFCANVIPGYDLDGKPYNK